jgi:hypothetical protein
MEEPFAPLDIDPARYDPALAARRMVGLTNALMERYKQFGDNQASITIMGTRTGDDYRKVRADQYKVESEIRALELKNSTLTSINFMKNHEMKYLSK